MKKFIIKTIIGCIIFVVVTFLIIFGYVKYQTYKINKDAKEVVDKFLEEVNKPKENEEENENPEEPVEVKPDIQIYYNDSVVIGVIEIPEINLSYPITEDISEKSMEKNIVALYGDLNQPGNTVLAGHAYLIGTYFSDIYKLSNGAEIYITDTSGKKVTYVVYKKFKTDKNDSSFYNRDTDELREITLSTCATEDENKRNIILAKEKK